MLGPVGLTLSCTDPSKETGITFGVLFSRVMESLNLLRYLVIRDKVTENQVSVQQSFQSSLVSASHMYSTSPTPQTGIWTELYKIEDTFIKPLRVGLNMSRAHYERELHDTMDGKKTTGQLQPSFAVRNTHMLFPSSESMFVFQSLSCLCLLEGRSCQK